MSVLIALEINGLPPTVNHLYLSKGRRRFKTKAGRMYQEHVTCLIRKQWKGRPPCKTPIEFRIILTAKDKRRWDIDNRVKALQDCLSMGGVIKDDTQVNILYVERKYGQKDKTYIEVKDNDKSETISE